MYTDSLTNVFVKQPHFVIELLKFINVCMY